MKEITEQDGKSLDLIEENLKVLKTFFPEAFTEDGIDFEILKQLLGDSVAEGDEKYGLTWYGKKKARQIALTPSLGTLRPCPEESVDWDTTQNLFIEGDNLEVLKLLQKSYANKVKMIYIDPPYNTGKEFIYPDKFQDNLDTYLRYTGQKSDEGFKFSSNTESSGRYHTNWLNMMYPRLKLARALLKDDGVIFISIDDNEQSNLKCVCDQIFGEENFVSCVVWQKRTSPDMRTAISEGHEYIFVYAKNSDAALPLFKKLSLTEKQRQRYKNPDDDPRGPWVSSDFTAQGYRPNQMYKILTPGGKEFYPPEGCCWKNVEDVYLRQIAEGRFWFGVNGNGIPRRKNYLAESEGRVPWSWWPNTEVGHTQEAKKEVNRLFGRSEVYVTPKPIRLIKRMLDIVSENDSFILDFFSGSCATADAVMQHNVEVGDKNKFLMVQLPEECDEISAAYKEGYRNIADIGKERIRRAAVKIKEENPAYKGDLGFKVFKLDSSNIRAWNPDRSDIHQTLIDHMEHLVEGRSEQDVLYELLLKRGVDLTVPIEEKTIIGKTVYSIAYGVLFACLDKTIHRNEIEKLAQGIIDWHRALEPAGDTQVVFRDSAFENDVAKTNMTAILEQYGIAHVRSL